MSGTGEPEPTYNTVYDRLVGDGADLVSMLAYAIYKKNKREWILRDNPSREERDRYHRFVTDGQLDLYRGNAASKLAAYAETILSEAAPTQRQQGANSEIVNIVRKQQSFGRNIAVNILGSLIFAVMLAFLAIALFSPGVREFFNAIQSPQAVQQSN
jgi:hypothetical protein